MTPSLTRAYVPLIDQDHTVANPRITTRTTTHMQTLPPFSHVATSTLQSVPVVYAKRTEAPAPTPDYGGSGGFLLPHSQDTV